MLSLFPDENVPKKEKVTSLSEKPKVIRTPSNAIELSYMEETGQVTIRMTSTDSTNCVRTDELVSALASVKFAKPIVIKTEDGLKTWSGINGKLTSTMVKEIQSALGLPEKNENLDLQK